MSGGASARPEPDGPRSWLRLALSLAIVTIGGAGMWCVVVALPAVQAEFAVDRSAASLPYTLLMLGIAGGGMVLGRLSDRFGIVPVSFGGGALLSLGFILSGLAPSLGVFAVVHGILIGIGCSASFGPILADISFWFDRRRGIAVAIVAAGNYVAGAIWPPLVQAMIDGIGWRGAMMVVGAICGATLLPLALLLGRHAERPLAAVPVLPSRSAALAEPVTLPVAAGLRPGTLQVLLALAGIGCCVAMSMPQVHIVAYCGDLGYGPARGAEMLSLMLAFGIISRVASGFVADRIGGLSTLLVGSVLQCVALVLYMLFDSLASLYVVSILFGLFQGGIVPSYAIIVREVFPPAEAGQRVGICIAATLVGMALGGWLSGWIFDQTGSYQAAFANGIGWNILNQAIVIFLILRLTARPGPVRAAQAVAA
ncbi:MFS transporter [Enterovirga sp.]|jgi:MFS family permease|uniref:MFS transporter n=1 Tax=Enterovirga sp. TaxID=2026350 RepID=UPI0026219634|nr:MFS transporter [Enterovirga sp.]MDB5589541.1 transporter [Enterovirga sp.]